MQGLFAPERAKIKGEISKRVLLFNDAAQKRTGLSIGAGV
jgi:hypothetical protein